MRNRSAAHVMPASIRLGRVGGIPIALHYSWFIIATLITLSLEAHFRSTEPDWGTPLIWMTSVTTALLFFVSLLAHELAHAIVAQARGLPVRSITLFALGGVAQIEKDASTAKTEFLVAVVGPITSLVIGFACIGIAWSMGWSVGDGAGGLIAAVLGWLGSINVALALFNLIPGYPLDGGRLLRALLWGIYGDGHRATRNAAQTGQAVAAIFIAWGLVQFFAGAGFSGLWLAFIGWFLLTAAQASYAQVTIGEALRGVRVSEVMTDDCITVDAAVNLQSLVDDLLLRTGRRCIVVKRDGRVLGLVTANEVRGVARDRWQEVTAEAVMRPLDQLKTVGRDTPVTEAFTMMAREDLNQLPVVSGGRLEGIVSRGQILQLLQSRAELRT
jgi:Zn-dependent protease/predicted transcriptional regulator